MKPKGRALVERGIYRLPSGAYLAIFRDSSGIQRSKAVSSKKAARDLRAEAQLRRRAPAPVQSEQPAPLFRAWSERWLESKVRHGLRSATRDKYRSILDTHLLPVFGDLSLDSITQWDVQDFVDSRVARYAPRSVREFYGLLAGTLKAAAARKLIGETPCSNVALPALRWTERRALTPAEVERLRVAMADSYKALVMTAAYLGPRWEELAALKRSRLHLQNGRPRMEIFAVIERDRGGYRYTEEMKTKESRRTILLPPFAARLLHDHLSHAPESEFVFPAREGGFLHYNNFRRRQWGPAVKAASLAPLRFHELRHTAAALMINAEGSDPYIVQRRLGHSNIRTTYGLYGHLFPSREDSMNEQLEKLASEATRDPHTPDDVL